MAPLDPQQLLKALNELLGPTGAIMGPTEAVRVANLMKDANKLVSKCIYINILKVETPADTLEKLLSSGGWDTINDWLQEAKEGENYPLLVEILKVYQLLPITVDILKKNNAAKTIKQLCKSDNENTKTLATNIFDEWMKKVKGNNNNDEKSKKKKEKGRDKDKDSEKKHSDKSSKKSDSSSSKSNSEHKSHTDHRSSTEHRSSSDNKSKSRDSRHSQESSHHKSDSSKRSKERDKKIEEENTDSNSNDSVESDDKVTVRQGSGLKLHIKLGSDKERTGSKSDDTDKKRISTVKRPPSKFRSTGLEEASVPSKLPKNADLSKPIPKRTGSDIKSELPSKRSRPNMPPPLSVPSASSSSSTPSATSPQSPGEIHGKIKIIPARPKPNHVLHESSGFMDSLDVGRPYGSLKKKRRLSGASATPPSKNSNVPSTPPSPVSPTTAIARSLPSVPSFYKDTQEAEPSPDKDDIKEEKKERSPSPTEVANGEIKSEVKSEPEESENKTDNEKTVERSPSPTESTSSTSTKESKGLLTTGATKVKKKKKSVTWKEDHEIKEVFFFEMDDEERVNVNRPKDFNQAQRNEMMADRRAFESSIRMKNDHMVEQITWYRPKLVIGHKVLEYGKDSKEKTIQKLREQSVLQALFFHKNMLPDNPQEPDMENEDPEEPKTIPVDDMSGGEEFLYNYDTHPQAVQNQGGAPIEPKVEPQFPPPMNPQQPPTSLPFSLPPGLQLPPDLANILSHIQNTQSNPNDPVMAQVQQILNNLMCGGNEQSYEQLQQIQQIMNSQMGLPPDGMMQGPPPGMPMMGMPPGGPPMGPRTLLGNAPPGFMPQRPMGPGPGPGPNRFGPPGNWGPQGNMGGPQMGQQGGNFRGGMRGQGQGRGHRGGRGGNFRVLCRHFASGKCRMGNKCTFLHPGINGPPLSEQQMQQMLDNPGNS